MTRSSAQDDGALWHEARWGSYKQSTAGARIGRAERAAETRRPQAPDPGNAGEGRISMKIYIRGLGSVDSRADARDRADATEASHTVYDTSGPTRIPTYADRRARGLPPLRERVDRSARRHARARAVRRRSTGSGAKRCPNSTPFALPATRTRAPREAGRERHADALRAARRDHARDGVHRDSRGTARRNSCATKSRAGAPSFRRTSIIPRASR